MLHKDLGCSQRC